MIMRIAAAQNLDSARRTDDEPARSSPAVTDEPARFQPVSGLIHSDVRRLAVSDDPLGGTTVSGRLADRLARPRAGSPLPDDVTASFGAQLGTDLSDVRVYADGEADDLARSVASTAFTVGSDIYFTRGNYSTTSESGRHLLAHELTHVMQNRQAPSSGVASAPTIGRADDPAERHADRVAGNVMQALRRRTSLETNSAATVVEQYRTAPTQTLRRLHRSVPARPVVRRMTIAAAELAKVEEKSVWVRNKDDRWVPGRIRQLRPYDMAGLPEQIAVVELADSTTVTARVVDVHDAPPPGAGLDDGPNLFGTGPDDKANPLQLALVPTGGDLDGGSPTELTPEVQHYFDLLSAIPKPQLDHEARLLLRDVHTDKGVGDLETFKAIGAALDLVRNPTPIQGEQKLLTVGEAEPLVVHTPHLEPPKLDAPQPERSTFFGPAAPSLPINGTPQLRPQTPRQPVVTPALDPNRRLQSPEFAPNEIQLLNQLHQVKNSADLARLSSTGRSASDLLTIAGLAAVTTLDGLVSLAMLGRSAADIVAIGGLRGVRGPVGLRHCLFGAD